MFWHSGFTLGPAPSRSRTPPPRQPQPRSQASDPAPPPAASATSLQASDSSPSTGPRPSCPVPMHAFSPPLTLCGAPPPAGSVPPPAAAGRCVYPRCMAGRSRRTPGPSSGQPACPGRRGALAAAACTGTPPRPCPWLAPTSMRGWATSSAGCGTGNRQRGRGQGVGQCRGSSGCSVPAFPPTPAVSGPGLLAHLPPGSRWGSCRAKFLRDTLSPRVVGEKGASPAATA